MGCVSNREYTITRYAPGTTRVFVVVFTLPENDVTLEFIPDVSVPIPNQKGMSSAAPRDHRCNI
jgi:hypothetical protein